MLFGALPSAQYYKAFKHGSTSEQVLCRGDSATASANQDGPSSSMVYTWQNTCTLMPRLVSTCPLSTSASSPWLAQSRACSARGYWPRCLPKFSRLSPPRAHSVSRTARPARGTTLNCSQFMKVGKRRLTRSSRLLNCGLKFSR